MMSGNRSVAYSTDISAACDPGASSLKLERVAAARRGFWSTWTCRPPNGPLVAELAEVESGKNEQRPEPAKAIVASKKTGASLLVVDDQSMGLCRPKRVTQGIL